MLNCSCRSSGRITGCRVSAGFQGIALRGSYGKSFRAPAFDELIGEAISLFQTEAVPDPASPTGTTNILGLFGYAPDVGPERATTWTAGIDVAPSSLAGFKASVTYYDVDYRDRIGTASEDYTRFLVDRARFGGLITDNPSLALVEGYFARPSFVNAANIAPGQVAAILDGRIRNLAAERQRGIDFDVGYSPAFAGGTLDLGIAGTHIFSIKQQLTPGGPQVDVVGTYAKPVKWRLRGRFGWATGGFSANAFVNYIDGYLNQVVTPMERVGSWTTFDLSISQRIGGGDGVEGRGLRLSLGITNLFDKDPPYVNNRSVSSALGYDPEKASPLGRMMSLQATIRW
jgi:iron complex outermembrane recepter protein